MHTQALKTLILQIGENASNKNFYEAMLHFVKTPEINNYYDFSISSYAKNIDNFIELVNNYQNINNKSTLSESQWSKILSLYTYSEHEHFKNRPISLFKHSSFNTIIKKPQWTTLANDILYFKIKSDCFILNFQIKEYDSRMHSVKRLHITPGELNYRRSKLRIKQDDLSAYSAEIYASFINSVNLNNLYQYLKSRKDLHSYLPKYIINTYTAIIKLYNPDIYNLIIKNKVIDVYKPLYSECKSFSEYKLKEIEYKQTLKDTNRIKDLYSYTNYYPHTEVTGTLKFKLLMVLLENATHSKHKLKYLQDLNDLFIKDKLPLHSDAYFSDRDNICAIFLNYIEQICRYVTAPSLVEHIVAAITHFSKLPSMHMDIYEPIFKTAIDRLSEEDKEILSLKLYEQFKLKTPDSYVAKYNVYWHVLVPHLHKFGYNTRLSFIMDFIKQSKLSKEDLNVQCRELFEDILTNKDTIEEDYYENDNLENLDMDILVSLLPEHTDLFKLGNSLNFTLVDHIEQLKNHLTISHTTVNNDINLEEFQLCT